MVAALLQLLDILPQVNLQVVVIFVLLALIESAGQLLIAALDAAADQKAVISRDL